jgi:hypothetical protein
MLMGELSSSKVIAKSTAIQFSKKDVGSVCIVGDVNFNVGCDDIFTVCNTVFEIPKARHIPARHFLEDSAYYMNVFGDVVKTKEILRSKLKSNREFMFDLMMQIWGEDFEDINNEIHESIRVRFFQ